MPSDFYYVTQGIEAIIISIFVAVLIIFLIYLFVRLRRTEDKLVETVSESKDLTVDASEVVGKLGSALFDYLLIKISDSIKKNK